jgi:hypothetical protein
VRITRRALRLVSSSAVAVALCAAVFVSSPVSAGAASSNKLTITASEYLFKISGSPQPGNVQLTFQNSGVDYHMLAIFQLKKGVTQKQLDTALMSDDQSAAQKLVVGSPVSSPSFLSPQQKTTTITSFKAGHYAAVCFFTAADGKSHAMHGMDKIFDVSGSKSSFQPPTDGVTDVTLTDTAVEVPSTGIPKAGWIKVTNASSVPRDLALAKYNPGGTYASASAYFNSTLDHTSVVSPDAPAVIVGGVFGIPQGKVGYVQSTLAPGNYAAVSSNDNSQGADPNEVHLDFTVS